MIRMTNQREIILEELFACRSHPTADELYRLVRVRLPRISLATVYRNLEQMAEAGLIRKVAFAGSQNRFDSVVAEHHHIICRECGAVADAMLEEGCNFSGNILPQECGYTDVSSLVEFTGICPVCRGKGKNNNKQI